MVMILTNPTPIRKIFQSHLVRQLQWQVSAIQTICAQHTMRKPVRPLVLEWNRDNLMIQHQVISLNGRLEKSECKWPKSKGFNFSCREFYLVEIKRQWRPFEEFVWIPTKAERREGWLEPETVGSDNGESDPFEGILDWWGNKTNFFCFHFLYRFFFFFFGGGGK